jgi:hypothetical protein
MSDSFGTSPWSRNYAGEPRRVGVEIEMAGVDAGQIGRAVCAQVGGRFESESAFLGRVNSPEFGEFRIELDYDLLTSRGYLRYLEKLGIEIDPGNVRDTVEDVMSRVAGIVVPHELVCPPLPFAQLPRLDRVRQALHEAGARGTGASPLYAFGLQFNVEIHDRDVTALLAMLRAFFLSYETLLELSDVDLSRRLSPYVQPYPEDYIVHVLGRDYAPDMTAFIDDFLRFTPTRNRPLDLLPLLAWIDEARVMAAPVEHKLIKPRPAWHYRLPNCLIDDPDWSLAKPWNDWIMVEELAADSQLLRRRASERLATSSGLSQWFARSWRRLRQGSQPR